MDLKGIYKPIERAYLYFHNAKITCGFKIFKNYNIKNHTQIHVDNVALKHLAFRNGENSW